MSLGDYADLGLGGDEGDSAVHITMCPRTSAAPRRHSMRV
jgi:hypothetical protein